MITDFLNGVGPSKILVYYQVQELNGNDDINSEPTLFVTTGDSDKLKEKGIFFWRNSPAGRKVNQQEPNDNDVIFGEVTPNVLVQVQNKIFFFFLNLFFVYKKRSIKLWNTCTNRYQNKCMKKKENGDSVKTKASKNLSN